MAFWGMPVEELSGPPTELWPDCVLPYNVFCALYTQWRVGFSGRYALDYAAILPTLKMMGLKLKGRRLRQLFDDLRTMETAALSELADQKAERDKQQAQQQHG